MNNFKIILFLSLITFTSCAQSNVSTINYVNLPPFRTQMNFTEAYDMFLNLQVDSNSIPNNVNYIVQAYGKDTLNILEFDNMKRLIFKYYRQYVGEYWNDRYVTMIETHIYDDNKLKKSIYLHSNTSFYIYKYEYERNNIKKMQSYEKSVSKEINTNPNRAIRNLTQASDVIEYIKNLDIDNEKNIIAEYKREFKENSILEYFKYSPNQKYKIGTTYNLDKFNRVISYNNPKVKIEYDDKSRIKTKEIKETYQDEFYTHRYEYINDSIKITEYLEDNFAFSFKTLYQNNIIRSKYVRDMDTSTVEIDKYYLDNYGFPKKVISQKPYSKDSIIKLNNHYIKR